MKKDEIQIIVAGVSGIGKSTVVQQIHNSLVNAGLNVTLITDSPEPIVNGGFQDRRLEAMIKKGIKVIVEERPVRHSLTEEDYVLTNPRS